MTQCMVTIRTEDRPIKVLPRFKLVTPATPSYPRPAIDLTLAARLEQAVVLPQKPAQHEKIGGPRPGRVDADAQRAVPSVEEEAEHSGSSRALGAGAIGSEQRNAVRGKRREARQQPLDVFPVR